MLVGVLSVEIYMQGLRSLKEKRSIVKSITGRLRSRFNISIAEVDHQDVHSRATLGISVVSNSSTHINQQFDHILNFMQCDTRFYIGQTERELF